ncbi:hypothetical protein OESDEN_03425 [Oesophagostomum dentatum]|uniref:glucuronosyltransferase n=1 Tax=Oesophagostomum dentatum TaxID=61180 RepID=A0A0B1TML4_OESDE|nr:hypothetical protein OESDEN_03425 [Oesophagostomum dentatum]
MANTNDLYEMPRPILAKVIGIGGVGMVNETKPLPEALSKRITKIMDTGDGAILLSFGSVAPAYKMPMEWKKIFLATFQRFPKYQFLVRYEKDDIAGGRMSTSVEAKVASKNRVRLVTKE